MSSLLTATCASTFDVKISKQTKTDILLIPFMFFSFFMGESGFLLKETLSLENSSLKRHIFSKYNVTPDMINLLIIVIAFCCSSIYSYAQVSNPPLVQVEIKETYGEYLDTFDSTYVPDGMYFEGPKIKIFFTEDEQKRIIKLADSLNFWELPDTLTYRNDSIAVIITHCPCPCSTRVQTRQKDKTVIADCFIADESYRHRLRELEYQISRIVHQKPEYRALKRRHFFRDDSTK
jgi:hypothetical protein